MVTAVVLGLLSGPAGFRPAESSAEAALQSEVKKLSGAGAGLNTALPLVPASQAGPVHQGAGVGQSVVEALQQGNEVEVDIALRAPPALGARPIDVEALTNQIAELQDGLLAGLAPADFRLGHRFISIPALTGTVTQSGLNKLAAHPAVLMVDLPAAGQAHLGEVVPLIEANDMHTAGFTGEGVIVAVLDSGLDTDHTDLANDLVGEECYNDCDNGTDRQSGPGAAEDDHGHGTHVTGIITATGSVSSVGVAPDAGILAYKVLDASNGFSSLTGNVVVALDDIIANHPEVDLVNMSLGTFALYSGSCDAWPSFNVIAATAINALRANGVAVFVSAGNDGSGTQMESPACITNSIAVGATWDTVDQVTDFSNSNSTTDIFAPGCSVVSTGLSNGIATFCGTSMASPASAGCAALLLEENATLTPAQIEARLKISPVSVTDPTNGLSFPRIDCFTPLGDTDGDGCKDEDENGPDEMFGGRRDPLNPWDYFNPTNDGQNRVDDILAVVNQYFEDEFLPSPPNPPDTPNPNYDEKYDRTLLGPDPWNLGPPDRLQRVDDILHAVNSYFHDCGTGIVKPTPTATPAP
jgi:subtilisin family serine protease